MINIRKRWNVYQYCFEAGKVNGKRKQITKSGFNTKNEAFIAGQKAYDEFINGVTTNECNMLYGDYLDYWMKEYFEINYKYSTAKRYKESFGNIKEELGNYKLSVLTPYILNQALLKLYQTSSTKEALRIGNEIKDISKLLGHSRTETTENYYITSTTNDLIKICESIEKEIDINLRDKFW